MLLTWVSVLGANNDAAASGGGTTIATLGAGADTFTGGAGTDTIVLVDGDSAATGFDKFITYGLAADAISTAGVTGTNQVFGNVTAVAGTTNGVATGLFTFDAAAATSFADALAKVGTDVAVAGNSVVFQYGNNAYVFGDVDGTAATATDVLIELVGVTATSMAASSQVFTIT